MTQSTNNINPLTGEPIGTYVKEGTAPFADFSDWQGEPILSEDPAVKQAAMDAASEDAAIAKALQEAKAAMNEAKEKQFKDALVKETQQAVKSGKLVPAKKAAKTSPAKKAGRVVGISADENKFLKNLLEIIADDENYAITIKDAAYSKLQARYNTK